GGALRGSRAWTGPGQLRAGQSPLREAGLPRRHHPRPPHLQAEDGERHRGRAGTTGRRRVGCGGDQPKRGAGRRLHHPHAGQAVVRNVTETRRRFAGLVGSRILAIADEVRALQAGGRQICNLSIGDFDPREFPLPPPLLERIRAALGGGETTSPPAVGIPALREQISALYARELGLAVPASSIVITGGSRPGLFAAYQLTIEPGDRVVFPVPSWNNDSYCELAGA